MMQDQKKKDQLSRLIKENKQDLQYVIQWTIDEYRDFEASGFVHTQSLSERIVDDLLDYFVDPQIKAHDYVRDILRGAMLDIELMKRAASE